MPVTDERDVWLAATALVETHGENAPLFALQSVDQLIERGDFAGAAEWRRVWRATETLLGTAPLLARC